MTKITTIAIAAFLVAGISAANAQAGGDNPGGRGVTSTGGPVGVTGANPDGTRAAPVATTGMSRSGSNAELRGDSANSVRGSNSPNSLSTGSASPAGGGEK